MIDDRDSLDYKKEKALSRYWQGRAVFIWIQIFVVLFAIVFVGYEYYEREQELKESIRKEQIYQHEADSIRKVLKKENVY